MANGKERTRVLKSESILSGYLTLGEEFLLGVSLSPDVVARTDFKKFGLSDNFSNGEVKVPKAGGPSTKANVNGKYGRKQPEVKQDIERHISYVRKKDNRKIEYDRVFQMYEKELKHKYNIELTFKADSNGEPTVFSPPLVFDNTPENNQRNTHVMNVILEIFKTCDVYRTSLEPYVRHERTFDEEILPPGKLSEGDNFEALIDIAKRHTNPEEIGPLTHRLEVFKEFNPIIRQSSRGLTGYYAFIFEDKGIVAAESIKRANATYFFTIDNYEENIVKDKQEIINNRLMLKRLSHTDNWEQSVRKFLNSY